MRPLPLLAALLALGSGAAVAQGSQATAPPATSAGQDAIMDRIERDIRLPEGARPLASYARFYAWQQREDDIRKVVALYDSVTGTMPPGRRWVTETDFPLVMDGGCAIVTLSYNVAEQRIEHVTCNAEG